LVLVGDYGRNDAEAAAALLGRCYLPRSVTAVRLYDPNNVMHRSLRLEPLFTGRETIDGEPTFFVCQHFTCQSPAVGLAAIESRLNALSKTAPK
jgi:hypothetical protein